MKETTYWGKWKREKKLEPGKMVILQLDMSSLSMHMYPDPRVAHEEVIVESDQMVQHIIKNPYLPESDDLRDKFLSCERINEAQLESNGPLSLLGIKTKIVYKREKA